MDTDPQNGHTTSQWCGKPCERSLSDGENSSESTRLMTMQQIAHKPSERFIFYSLAQVGKEEGAQRRSLDLLKMGSGTFVIEHFN